MEVLKNWNEVCSCYLLDKGSVLMSCNLFTTTLVSQLKRLRHIIQLFVNFMIWDHKTYVSWQGGGSSYLWRHFLGQVVLFVTECDTWCGWVRKMFIFAWRHYECSLRLGFISGTKKWVYHPSTISSQWCFTSICSE